MLSSLAISEIYQGLILYHLHYPGHSSQLAVKYEINLLVFINLRKEYAATRITLHLRYVGLQNKNRSLSVSVFIYTY